MSKKEHTEEYYCFVNKLSGHVVTFEETDTNSTNCCGETQINLYDCKGYRDEPVWKCSTYEHCLRVLHNPTPWYNSDIKSPTHSLTADTYEIVKRHVYTVVCTADENFPSTVEDAVSLNTDVITDRYKEEGGLYPDPKFLEERLGRVTKEIDQFDLNDYLLRKEK